VGSFHALVMSEAIRKYLVKPRASLSRQFTASADSPAIQPSGP
jgi:hypothetical protein